MTGAPLFLQPLLAIGGIRAGWIERIPGLDVSVDRTEAMNRLREHHLAALEDFSGNGALWRAEQVHGADVAIVPHASTVEAPDGLPMIPGVDGLVTAKPGQVLAIHVADCGAIWLADRKTRAVGLLHSGKKGTDGNILGNAIATMASHFGTCPEDVVAILSPCIRPPDYEVDFAAEIARQAAAAGIAEFHDCGLNTAADPDRFYSYRIERGKTGRMMAMIVSENQ